MFFSVIVPVYKVEEYLPSCIDSVLKQTFADFELILVDDGSPDTCPQLCEEYAKRDPRIVVLHKENGGLASARRAGIRIARGEYVFNLDSDDLITLDALETAHKLITETACEIVSFSYRWVKNGQTVNLTTDAVEEGLYVGEDIRQKLYPRLLMNRDMQHLSFYLAGKAIKREFLLPHQLGVSESISLGEDLCCVVPCYLHASSVYVSKKAAYFYNVRESSLSKEFNVKQITLIENVIRELCKHPVDRVPDFEEQLCRYSCFMCFTVLAAAAEGNHKNKIDEIQATVAQSIHAEKIQAAAWGHVSPKSRIAFALMKRNRYRLAFYFLNACKTLRIIIKGR